MRKMLDKIVAEAEKLEKDNKSQLLRLRLISCITEVDPVKLYMIHTLVSKHVVSLYKVEPPTEMTSDAVKILKQIIVDKREEKPITPKLDMKTYTKRRFEVVKTDKGNVFRMACGKIYPDTPAGRLSKRAHAGRCNACRKALGLPILDLKGKTKRRKRFTPDMQRRKCPICKKFHTGNNKSFGQHRRQCKIRHGKK